MHLADRIELPDGYSARGFLGEDDFPVLTEILRAHRAFDGELDLPTAEMIATTYANQTQCDLDRDLAVIENAEGRPIMYGRTPQHPMGTGVLDCIVFVAAMPDALTPELFTSFARAEEAHHVAIMDSSTPARFRAYAGHPGPGKLPTGQAAWLESLDYEATEWSASLLRPTLDDIPELELPDGVEVRPVQPEQMREIVAAYHECFRGEWDFEEIDEGVYAWLIDDPRRDESLWQVAWAGDTIVGQVKPYIDEDENTEHGHLRGYAEYISTHREWRNQGIAGALLARSLQVLKDRGMTEAMLGVDTNNPGGAFQLYTKLGFELESYEAVYTKPLHP